MPTMQPFSPRGHSTQKASVAAGANVKVTLPLQTTQVWVDNRGAYDLLIEFDDQPLDSNSFRVPANSALILSVPATSIYLSRPAGAVTEDAYITPGGGF